MKRPNTKPSRIYEKETLSSFAVTGRELDINHFWKLKDHNTFLIRLDFSSQIMLCRFASLSTSQGWRNVRKIGDTIWYYFSFWSLFYIVQKMKGHMPPVPLVVPPSLQVAFTYYEWKYHIRCNMCVFGKKVSWMP